MPSEPPMPPPSETITYPNATAEAPKAAYSIRSGVILSRPPILTRELTPFESSFYLYQKRLAERLSGRFPRKAYFKVDTPAEQDWQIKFKERRKTMAKEIGIFDPDGRDSWDDEVRLGLQDESAQTKKVKEKRSKVPKVAAIEEETMSATAAAVPFEEKNIEVRQQERQDSPWGDEFVRRSDLTQEMIINIEDPAIRRSMTIAGTGEHDHLLADQARIREILVRSAEMRVSEDGEVLKYWEQTRIGRPLSRETEADKTNDQTRLDRKLDQTLYLVVKGENGVWGFPTSDVRTDEAVHETASRALEEAAGVNMNTWMVGRQPIAHTQAQPVFQEDSTILEKKGNKVFYLKGRIMAGQADLRKNTLGLTEFKWLTKEELESVLKPELYHKIRNCMGER